MTRIAAGTVSWRTIGGFLPGRHLPAECTERLVPMRTPSRGSASRPRDVDRGQRPFGQFID